MERAYVSDEFLAALAANYIRSDTELAVVYHMLLAVQAEVRALPVAMVPRCHLFAAAPSKAQATVGEQAFSCEQRLPSAYALLLGRDGACCVAATSPRRLELLA